MWVGEVGFTERPWMRFIAPWLMLTVIEGQGKEIFEGFGSLASMRRRDSMVFHTAV
jgi:hypothetical protein